MKITLFISFIILIFIYIVYPAALFLLSKAKIKKIEKKEMCPLTRAIKLLIVNPTKFFRIALRYLYPGGREYGRRLRWSLRHWLLYQQKDIVLTKCYWMGVRAIKNPLDAWIYQEIVYEVKPDIIIEIGSAEGGTTLYFANLLDLIGKGTVISIDHDRSKYHVIHNRITTLTGDSSSAEIIEEVIQLCRGKSALVVHDGDHRKEQVLKELRLYSPLVKPGSYFIVEDGIVDLLKPGDGIGWFREGPLAAVREFLRENYDFVADKERERYILTYNPKGFLKRVR